MAEEIVIFSRTGAKANTVVGKSQSTSAKSVQKADVSGRRLSLSEQKALAAYLSGNL